MHTLRSTEQGSVAKKEGNTSKLNSNKKTVKKAPRKGLKTLASLNNGQKTRGITKHNRDEKKQIYV